MRVGVVGAGTMGAAIAALFANADHDVVLVDVSEEALRKAENRHRGECLQELEKAGLRKRDEVVSKVEYTTDLRKVESCEFVVEAIREKLKDKISLFRDIEKIVEEGCILATNTSSFKPSEIAEHLEKPERLTLFHLSNPPILMPLVEVGGERVSKDVLSKTVEIAKKIGKEPVVIKKECRGHILNRMLGAAGAGVSYSLLSYRPEQIDAALKGLGMPFGFFEMLDLIGLDVVRDVLDSFREVYGRRFEGFAITRFFIEKMIEWEKLGKKSGEGFYRWVGGRAEVPEGEAADITPLVAAIVNEALRIVREGVADRETVNRVYKLATNAPFEILDVAEMIGFDNIAKVLEEVYSKTGLEIYKA